jgi:hypothetical protein
MYRTNHNQNMNQLSEPNESFDIVPKMRPKKAYTPKKQVIEVEWTVPVPAGASKKKAFKIIEREKKQLRTGIKNYKNQKTLTKLLQNIENDDSISTSETCNENNSVISDVTMDTSLQQNENENENENKNENENNVEETDDNDSVSTSLSVHKDHPVRFTERQTIKYPKETSEPINNPDEETIDLLVESWNCTYKIKLKIQKVFDNQKDTAIKICDTFSNKQKIIQLIIARTQTGKTGCMIEFINKYINRYKIPINHIFIIANISSKDWMNQTKQRVPQVLEKQIFHLPMLNSEFREAVEGKKNILIIVDEAHCAALKQQTISKLMSKSGMDWNLDKMLEDDIKIVQFSATPDGLIFGYKKKEWPTQHYEVHTMKEGEGYYGISQMLKRKDKVVLKQAKDLNGKDKNGFWKCETSENEINQNIGDLFNDILSFQEPKYSIIRCHGTTFEYISDNIQNYLDTLPHMINNKINSEFRTYTEDGDILKGQLDALLKIKPDKHTIILIKEMLKCSNTLCKTHIGVVYERCTAKDINDSFIIQGLLGRITGYGSHDIICYTNLDSIEKYEKLFENNFDKKTLNEVQWNSNTTKVTTRGTKGKATYIDPGQILTENTISKVHGIPIRIDFRTDEAHTVFCDTLKNNLNKTRKTKEDYKDIHDALLDGIKEGLISVSTHKNSKLYSKNEIKLNTKIYDFFSTRILKSCRIYKHGDVAKSRRYKSWNNAYLTGKADSAQSGNGKEYSIDMCKDNWEWDGYTNEKTIAWISYKEE